MSKEFFAQNLLALCFYHLWDAHTTPHCCRSFVILMNHYVVNLKVASRPHKIWFQQKTITYICYTSYCSLLPSNHQSSSLAITIINTKWIILDLNVLQFFDSKWSVCFMYQSVVGSRVGTRFKHFLLTLWVFCVFQITNK